VRASKAGLYFDGRSPERSARAQTVKVDVIAAVVIASAS
jgi:hypothetical protein